MLGEHSKIFYINAIMQLDSRSETGSETQDLEKRGTDVMGNPTTTQVTAETGPAVRDMAGQCRMDDECNRIAT
jgi:hypothetical protein